MQTISQDDLSPDIKMLPRDEIAIYDYKTLYPSASHISKTVFFSNKNEETDGFITVTNRKTKKGNRTPKKNETRSSPYKKTHGEESHSQN